MAAKKIKMFSVVYLSQHPLENKGREMKPKPGRVGKCFVVMFMASLQLTWAVHVLDVDFACESAYVWSQLPIVPNPCLWTGALGSAFTGHPGLGLSMLFNR